MAKPAAGASRAIYESFSNVGSLWPKDPLRPESNFGQSVVTAAERALTLTNEEGKQGAALPPGAMSSQGVKTRVDSKQLQYRDMSKEEEEVAAAGLKALRQIREGVASHRVSGSYTSSFQAKSLTESLLSSPVSCSTFCSSTGLQPLLLLQAGRDARPSQEGREHDIDSTRALAPLLHWQALERTCSPASSEIGLLRLRRRHYILHSTL